jgi:hypothetical protein
MIGPYPNLLFDELQRSRSQKEEMVPGKPPNHRDLTKFSKFRIAAAIRRRVAGFGEFL